MPFSLTVFEYWNHKALPNYAILPPLKSNGCKTDDLERDLLPLAFLREIR